MQKIENVLVKKVNEIIYELYNQNIDDSLIQIRKTLKEFEGDFTLVVFPLLKYSKKSVGETANEIGTFLLKSTPEIKNFNVIKGFLNMNLSVSFWKAFFISISKNSHYGIKSPSEIGKKIVIEFSSPNTNKPLHLGHIRNNLIGWSVAKILESDGHRVIKVNLVNDRGIHICKSMLAWQETAHGKTPKSEGIKGDHFVGDYYVAFEKEYRRQIDELVKAGSSEDIAKNEALWMKKARMMLKEWENKNPDVLNLWNTMNDWVYKGFEETYQKLGISFDKIYYESETYLKGKDAILNAVEDTKLRKNSDGSISIDLTPDGFDEKILLRSDGTALYITQDLGTAIIRFEDYRFDKSIYVVGNEQDYHFRVMKLILEKMGYEWSKDIYHLSYGMVELPEGKMKSREGKVVDADDLIEEMIHTAKQKSEELGKLEEFNQEEKNEIYRKLAFGALKYFILKPDSRKNMTFNPEESIDFNGNTGPFIQYTYVRIISMLQKAQFLGISENSEYENVKIFEPAELSLLKIIYAFEDAVTEASNKLNSSVIANYVYELSKEYNKFYHEIPAIIKEENQNHKSFRLALSMKTAEIIKNALDLLGIEVPERM
jgi:arginyl-tRNA synthetase